MRGRLINPFFAKLAQFDTVATAANDPDGAGPLTSGYDPIFKEPVKVTNTTDTRIEKDPIFVPCQVEVDEWEKLSQFQMGDVPGTHIRLVFHYRDLEELGLVDPTTGDPLIRKNDRLVSLHECPSQELIQHIRTPPGLYATEPLSRGFGLSGGKRNMLITTFQDREQGHRGGT